MAQSFDGQKLMTIDELCRYLSFTKSAIYAMTHKNAIPFTKFGRVLRFDRVEIDAWVNAKKVPVNRFAEELH